MSAQPNLDSGFGVGWSCNINEGRHLGKTVGQFMAHKFFHPDSKRNLIIKYIAEQKWEAKQKRLKDQKHENARYAELEETRRATTTGLELKRAEGGVSFIYDDPPTFEKWNDEREKRKKEIEGKYLYEWQKNAPRHEFVDSVLPTDVAGSVALHNPFGVQVKKIKYPCFKCGSVGHLAYDKECPRYAENLTNEEKKQKGKSVFVVEVEPERLERLVDDFNKHYDQYHETVDIDGKRMGYYKRHVELNPTVVNELRQSSELDPAKSYKDADEQYVDSLSPMERQVLFTTIRRVIRDKKRKEKIKLLEVENYRDADLIQISDDSESDGEYELGVNDLEKEFTEVLDELVFGSAGEVKQEIPDEEIPAIAKDLAAQIKTEVKSEDLSDQEEQMRKRLTRRKCQEIVVKKNMEEELGTLEKDPLAEAVKVYVAEGKTLEEVEVNLRKLEEEKKKSIEARIREKQQRHQEQMKKLEDKILRGITDEDLTEETRALHAIKHRRKKGYEAINKIQSINVQLAELNEKIVKEENDRKAEKEKKSILMANRSEAEQMIRERIERRRVEAEKESRRREREEKRKLKKMSKKLNRLKEQEEEKTLREVGFSSLSELQRVGIKRKCFCQRMYHIICIVMIL